MSTRFGSFRRRVRFLVKIWCVLCIFYLVTRWTRLVRWMVPPLPPNFYPESSVFLQVADSDTYLYSAVVNMAPDGAPDILPSDSKGSNSDTNAQNGGDRSRTEESYRYIVDELGMDLEIVITGLDKSRSWASSFACCVMVEEHEETPFAVMASTYFEYVKPFSWETWLKEYWLSSVPSVYVATQYSCRIPKRHLRSATSMPKFATMAPMPSLLARVLSPFLLLDWPSWGYHRYCPTHSVDYLPVEYPLRAPKDLGLCSKINHNGGVPDTNHRDPDVLLQWFELQRHLGVDRIVVYNLGDKSPDLQGIFMYYQFFITSWTPSHPLEKLLVLRHQQTRAPRWECWKYVFLPTRVKAAITHEVFPKRPFSPGAWISADVATLHHYRVCPRDTWGTCEMRDTKLDSIMTRYRDALTSGVDKANAVVKTRFRSMDEEGEED
ncbi:hypothetical protein PoB_004890800 [Plakobranchus ocellatus]|uniref:Glycosyltransferase family 92 protein n=1 Tax=Plakobranchus ocellatus TaxID=259542 RepID=A0AAV4BS13_9GAST|nr:hypothetical protein PoB_004890800 [Plakobranchus ocellatus]